MADTAFVLVVGDGEALRAMVRVIEQDGHAVREMPEDGAAFDALAGGLVPSLVLLDLRDAEQAPWRVLNLLETSDLHTIPLVVLVDGESAPEELDGGSVHHLEADDVGGALQIVQRYLRPH